MKMLIDSNKFNEAFYTVESMKMSIHTLPIEYIKKKLQKACDILKVMSEDNVVDTDKILVDETFLEKIINTFLLIDSQCNVTGKPREAMRLRINDIRTFINRSRADENISRCR